MNARNCALLTLCLLFVSVSASAQTPATPATEQQMLQDVQNRANRLIDQTMKLVAERVKEFNAEVSAINQIRPLELQNLDSSVVSENVPRILQFVSYLSTYQHSSDSVARGLEDTLFALQSEMPKSIPDNSLTAFQKSYTADREAFDKYVATLRQLYQQVLDVLLFMQHTRYHIANGHLEINTKADIDTYQKLMKKIDGTSKELKRAMEDSRKATAWANKKIEEINKKHGSGE